jgi:hypothetical protein
MGPLNSVSLQTLCPQARATAIRVHSKRARPTQITGQSFHDFDLTTALRPGIMESTQGVMWRVYESVVSEFMV